ncbi:MAG: S8 family serine peptidase [Chrysiogenetes bacterium]|nr:S8 family serine peptidase [Chrysiogenetes bacterium]
MATILVAAMAACSGNSTIILTPGMPGVPVGLEFRRAPAAMEWQNQTWADIEVRVIDGFGDPVTSADNLIALTLVSGTGTISGTQMVSAASGVATFSGLAYDTAETITLRFDSEDLDSTDNAQMVIEACTPSVPVKLGFGTPMPASALETEAWSTFTVEIQDCTGAVLTGESATVMLAQSGGEGSLSGTTSKATAAGVATFDDISYDVVEDLQVSFTASGLRPILGHGISILPLGPTGLAAWGGNGRVRLRWQPHPDAISYVVYAAGSTGLTPMSAPGTVSPGVDFCETGLSAAADRYYVVSTVAANGEGGYSGEAMATTLGGLGYNDPLLGDQWHIDNTGQDGADPCEDADVQPAWEAGNDGTGVRVVVVDTGFELDHEDLADNVLVGESYDYDSGGTNPPGGSHGTAVAGIIAAVRDNSLGGSGIAPGASILSYNLIAVDASDADEADAMSRDAVDNNVSSNSWGPYDDFGDFTAPPAVWEAAVEDAVENGRGGLGLNFFWAGGNGAPVDNSNGDGFANFWGVNAVCAAGDDGVRASYSEPGANLLVCGPSEGDSGQGITTTDREGSAGYNSGNYTSSFNGTSAATPMISGVTALMLEANPALTWRDVREILARTARMNDPTDPGWNWNGATPPMHVNHNYGFGMVDAGAAVEMADGWTPQMSSLPEEFATPLATPGDTIVDNNPAAAVSDTITVSGSGIDFIEFVQIEMTLAHDFATDLRITLTAPSGTVSVLAVPHDCFFGGQGTCDIADGWRFGSTRQMGEAADGDWTVSISDEVAGDAGVFTSWRLRFYGR